MTLDHDTKSAAGMVDISGTIFEQVSKAAVFVADVTPIVRTGSGKAIPNPNVMVELGYALKALGPQRIIAILNSGSGSRIEDLPFDIRHRRILTYSLQNGLSREQQKAVREELVSDLTSAIRRNVQEVRVARARAAPISEAEESTDRPGLWKAEWPAKHAGPFGGTETVMPTDGDRAYLRVIPASWPNGKPPISALDGLPGTAQLWAPHGDGNSGNFGPCRF